MVYGWYNELVNDVNGGFVMVSFQPWINKPLGCLIGRYHLSIRLWLLEEYAPD